VADAGGLRLAPAMLDVAAEAGTVRAALEPRAHAAGVAIALDVPADTAAYADARRLRQVLSNLVTNAIAHTPPGGRVDLVARAAGDGRTVEIRVDDTGEGIPEAHRARVFDRFHRVDPSRSRATGGRGLGLAIVRQYVEAMGGAVEAGETPSGGASLRVRLPAVPGGWDGPRRA